MRARVAVEARRHRRRAARARRRAASCSARAAGRRSGCSTRCGRFRAFGRAWRAPRCALRAIRPTSSCWSTSARSTCGWRGCCAALGFARPIVYYAPPSAWLDNPERARRVAELCDALTLFRHQADFYRALGLPIGYVGHPLVRPSRRAPARPRRRPAAASSRCCRAAARGEIERHTPRLLDALARVREMRPTCARCSSPPTTTRSATSSTCSVSARRCRSRSRATRAPRCATPTPRRSRRAPRCSKRR